MERITVIEILERSGKLKELVKLHTLPFSIGRGYDNDLILLDPYISPKHLQIIKTESGQLEAVDLESQNGMYQTTRSGKQVRLELFPTSEIRIGHTILRFRGPASQLDPTAVDEPIGAATLHWLERPVASLGLAALAMAFGLLVSYQSYFSHADIRRWMPAAVGLLLLHVISTLPWAGMWALVSRIISHRAHFFAHMAVASIAILLWHLITTLQSYGNFAFANSDAVSFVVQLLFFALGTAVVYLHLQYAALASRFRALLISSGFAFFVVGIALLFSFSQQFDFSYDMNFPRDLKPPAFKISRDKTVDQFLGGTAHLEGEIQTLLKE